MNLRQFTWNDWATVPNAITVVRLLLVVPIAWLLIADERPILTLVLLTIFGLSDWVDGFVARRFGQVSPVGVLLDPFADRLGIIVIAVAFVVGGAIPLWIGIAVGGTDLVLGIAYVSLVPAAMPAATWWGKVSTFLLMGGLAVAALARVDEFIHWASIAAIVLGAGALLHLVVGVGYLRTMWIQRRGARRDER